MSDNENEEEEGPASVAVSVSILSTPRKFAGLSDEVLNHRDQQVASVSTISMVDQYTSSDKYEVYVVKPEAGGLGLALSQNLKTGTQHCHRLVLMLST